MAGQAVRWRLNVTPQARAISAVSAPASRIARARAILGSLMSGVPALMPLTVRGEGGVVDSASPLPLGQGGEAG